MKFRKGRLEFGVTCLADIRFLYWAWDRFWTLEAGGSTESPLLYITIEDRLPGEQVNLNFQAQPEVLERFLGNLEQAGLKFSRHDLIPGFLTKCWVEKDRGGLTVIGGSGAGEPGGGPEA
jgi:hypothetical protein